MKAGKKTSKKGAAKNPATKKKKRALRKPQQQKFDKDPLIDDSPEHDVYQGEYLLDDIHDRHINRRLCVIYLHPATGWPDENSEPLEAGVNNEMSDEFCRNLDLMTAIALEREVGIVVDMSTPGGDWEAGMQIFSAIVNCEAPISVLGRRVSRSMSSIIPLAADNFELDLTARYMFHRGMYGFDGLEQEADTEDFERRISTEVMMGIYVSTLKRRGPYKRWSRPRIRRLLEDMIRKNINKWFSPTEAVRLGFANAVFRGNRETLRATKIDAEWREELRELITQPITVKIETSVGGVQTSSVVYKG